MATEKVSISGQEHEIEVKPITIICKSPELTDDIKYLDRLALGTEECLYHMDRTQTFHAKTPYYIKKVFPQLKIEEINPTSVRASGFGVRHFAGRIDLTLKFIDMKVPVAWVLPEAGLHPASQAELADVLIELTSLQTPEKE